MNVFTKLLYQTPTDRTYFENNKNHMVPVPQNR